MFLRWGLQTLVFDSGDLFTSNVLILMAERLRAHRVGYMCQLVWFLWVRQCGFCQKVRAWGKSLLYWYCYMEDSGPTYSENPREKNRTSHNNMTTMTGSYWSLYGLWCCIPHQNRFFWISFSPAERANQNFQIKLNRQAQQDRLLNKTDRINRPDKLLNTTNRLNIMDRWSLNKTNGPNAPADYSNKTDRINSIHRIIRSKIHST